MSKLLKPRMLSPQSLRAWWAARTQKRRRRHGSAAPLPVVTLSNGTVSIDIESANIDFDIAVDLKTWPAASLEIWVSINGSAYFLMDLVASSTTHYLHFHAAGSDALFKYKTRYVSSLNIGPFSNELTVNVVF